MHFHKVVIPTLLDRTSSSKGFATDEDINNSLLNITWESDIDGIFILQQQIVMELIVV